MATSGVFARAVQEMILFADDDADTRFVYQCVATGEGFAVELAADGYEAIALANVFMPDVIVLDMRLPGIDGLEVIRRLRESRRTREIPIIVVSGDRSPQLAKALDASGCEGRLMKPCSAEDLMGLAQALARRPRKSRRAAGLGRTGPQ